MILNEIVKRIVMVRSGSSELAAHLNDIKYVFGNLHVEISRDRRISSVRYGRNVSPQAYRLNWRQRIFLIPVLPMIHPHSPFALCLHSLWNSIAANFGGRIDSFAPSVENGCESYGIVGWNLVFFFLLGYYSLMFYSFGFVKAHLHVNSI